MAYFNCATKQQRDLSILNELQMIFRMQNRLHFNETKVNSVVESKSRQTYIYALHSSNYLLDMLVEYDNRIVFILCEYAMTTGCVSECFLYFHLGSTMTKI